MLLPLAVLYTLLHTVVSFPSPSTVLIGSGGGGPNTIQSLIFTPPSSVDARDGKLVEGPAYPAILSPSWVTRHPTIPDLFYSVVQNTTDGGVAVGRLSADRKSYQILATA